MNVYLDSSILLRVLLNQSSSLAEWGRWLRAVTSSLTRVEVRRTVERLALERKVTATDLVQLHRGITDIEALIEFVPVSERVLREAGRPLPTAVKTLDAIHLLSAVLFRDAIREPLIFATHDRQQALGARALGFEVIGVEP